MKWSDYAIAAGVGAAAALLWLWFQRDGSAGRRLGVRVFAQHDTPTDEIVGDRGDSNNWCQDTPTGRCGC